MTDQPAHLTGPATGSTQDASLVTERYVTTVAPVVPGVPTDAGLEALVVTIMQIITTEQVREMQTRMADVQGKLAARQRVGQLLRQVTHEHARIAGQPAYGALVDEVSRALTDQLSAMNELSDTESQRLQEAMDRMSKMMSTLSNILKKIRDTEQSIINNLK